MDIIINMTAREVEIALGALGAMGDNEHDKGERDDLWQALIWELATEKLQGELAERAQIADLDEATASRPVCLDVSLFALMVDAVGIYCAEPVSIADTEEAAAIDCAEQEAFAVRLEKLPPVLMVDHIVGFGTRD